MEERLFKPSRTTHHACERFVDFKQIHVLLRQTSLLQDLWDGQTGANAHDAGLEADDGALDVLADDLLAESLGRGALHQQDRSRAVGHLTGVTTGRGRAPVREGGADLGEPLVRRARSDAVVLVHRDGLLLLRLRVDPLRRHRRNLVRGPPFPLRAFRAVLGHGCELVLIFPGDFEVSGDVFGCPAHGLEVVFGDWVFGDDGAHWRGLIVVGRHALDANGDTDVDGTDSNGTGHGLY